MTPDEKQEADYEYYAPNHKTVMVPIKVSYHKVSGIIYSFDKLSLDDVQNAMNIQRQTNWLVEAEREENDGRGITCVRSIISSIHNGDIESAKNIYRSELDKIRQYPQIENHLKNMFGCSIHFEQNCQKFPCAR